MKTTLAADLEKLFDLMKDLLASFRVKSDLELMSFQEGDTNVIAAEQKVANDFMKMKAYFDTITTSNGIETIVHHKGEVPADTRS